VTLDNDDAEPPKKQGGNTPQKRLSKVREFSPDLRKKLAQKVLDTANEEVPAAPTAIKVVAPLTGTVSVLFPPVT
jgi:hypothetical protein